MNLIPTEAFISGRRALYTLVREYPDLRMVPIEHLDTVKTGLHNLGYQFRIRYRGPHLPQHDTLKRHARAFTVYFDTPLI